MNVYTDNGYEDRQHYLQCLAEDNGVPLRIVHAIAGLYGEEEDFDGLVTALTDIALNEDSWP